jgi:hypothetical protein
MVIQILSFSGIQPLHHGKWYTEICKHVTVWRYKSNWEKPWKTSDEEANIPVQFWTQYLLTRVLESYCSNILLSPISKPGTCTIQQDTLWQTFPCSRLSATTVLRLHSFMLQGRQSQRTSVGSYLTVLITATKKLNIMNENIWNHLTILTAPWQVEPKVSCIPCSVPVRT